MMDDGLWIIDSLVADGSGIDDHLNIDDFRCGNAKMDGYTLNCKNDPALKAALYHAAYLPGREGV